MSDIRNIPLNQIDPNPWQSRQTETQEHIEQLAASIKANGLLQIPSGREMPDGRYQQAFGHNRKAAFQMLNMQGEAGYSEFPLNIVEYTDEQMAIAAFTENEKRQDLNPVERAKAMSRLIESFQWSHAQVAEKLNLDRSTVTNMLRILKMPEDVQGSISTGVLSQRAAMALLPWYELTPLELGLIEKVYPDATDFIALARTGQVLSDTIRLKVTEYIECTQMNSKKTTQTVELPTKPIAGSQSNNETSETIQEPAPKNGAPETGENEAADITEETDEEDDEPKDKKTPSKSKEPTKSKEPAKQPTPQQPIAVGAVGKDETLLTVKWTANGVLNGVLVGVQRFGEVPKMRFVKQLAVDEMPALFKELGIQ